MLSGGSVTSPESAVLALWEAAGGPSPSSADPSSLGMIAFEVGAFLGGGCLRGALPYVAVDFAATALLGSVGARGAPEAGPMLTDWTELAVEAPAALPYVAGCFEGTAVLTSGGEL